ncbi:hypothetical protein BDF14DRAFT_1839113 [Spinellus fusiger]|nr:hypothetical protein BDF14DRAFT_1839113 [Spinellus fusiger]
MIAKQSLVPELPVHVPENMPYLGSLNTLLHMLQTIITLLCICVVVPVLVIEIRYYGTSQTGPNYTLFATLISLIVPLFLIYFPWMYDRKNKCKTLGKFCLQPRTVFVLSIFYAMLWLLAGIAMTVHTHTASHCAIDPKLEVSFGQSYTSAWAHQCRCATVVMLMAWTLCVLWVASLLGSSIILWNEKQWMARNRYNREMDDQEESKPQNTPRKRDSLVSLESHSPGQSSSSPTVALSLSCSPYYNKASGILFYYYERERYMYMCHQKC